MKTLTKEELIYSFRGDNTKRRDALYSSVKVLEALIQRSMVRIMIRRF
ncbi:hypothetical protein [Spirosoma endophyticum]|nr:hypothetical protein [Spirosoma endophyticum]